MAHPFPDDWSNPTCPVCGASVNNTGLHEAWHRSHGDVEVRYPLPVFPVGADVTTVVEWTTAPPSFRFSTGATAWTMGDDEVADG